MNKIRLTIPTFLLTFISLVYPQTTYAVCPVCTVAVAGGLGLSRYLGIDDVITGLWLGGLIVSFSFWSFDYVSKKYPKITKSLKKEALLIFSILIWYLLSFVPLFAYGVIGHPGNSIFGIDKLLLGSVIGSIIFLLAIMADKKVRQVKGHQLFIYQKVLFPVSFLALASLTVYYLLG